MATAEDLTQLATTLVQLAQRLAEHETEPASPPAQTMPAEQVMFTAEEAAKQLRIGRTLMFRLIRKGEIASVQIGRLRRIPMSAIHDYAARLVNTNVAPTAA